MGAAATAKASTTFGTSLPPIPPGGTEVCPFGRIRLGVFFDGTNNNAYRDWGLNFLDFKAGSTDPDFANPRGPDKGTDAKEEDLNGPTNVAKLYLLFEEQVDYQRRVYATGVGGGDKTQVPGTMITSEAMSGAGGEARINWAIAALTDFVNRNGHEKAIEKRVDTFGFSRGATQARDFLNKVVAARIENKNGPVVGHRWVPKEGAPRTGRGQQMVKQDVHEEMKGILFEYLGIMDTVASEGLGAVYQWGDSLAGYDLEVHGRPKDPKKKPSDVLKPQYDEHTVKEAEGWVHQTLHQVADDEHRDVFALEVLGPDPKGWWNKFKPLPKNMREQSYPGCHADIGGAYRNTPRTATAEPTFQNISTITLLDMIADAKKAYVPFQEAKAVLPPMFSDPNFTGGDSKVPQLMGLYNDYCAMRGAFISKHFDPKFADWSEDIVHDPVYIQSLPDGKYEDFVKERDKSDVFQKLSKHYVHNSAAGVYRWGADPARRVVKSAVVPAVAGFFVAGPPGAVASVLIFGNRRDINPFSSTRQRDVHYHGFQNSYDKK